MAKEEQKKSGVDLAAMVADRLGFKPGSKPKPNGSLIDAAIEAVRQKRAEAAKAEAEKMIDQAVQLTETFYKNKSEAEKALAKAEADYNKAMGELEKQIQAAYSEAQDATEEVEAPAPEAVVEAPAA